MSPEHSLNERRILASQVRFLRVMSVGLVSVILALIALVSMMVWRDTTVIVPAEVRRPYELGANFASTDYLTDMANYVLDKVLTVTPESVDYNNRVILKMTHPDGSPSLKASLDAAALRLKKERITTVWIPRNEKVSANAKTVEVSGQLKTFIADQLTSTRDKTYLVQFTVTLSGRLYVSSIEEVVKHDPATGKPAA